MQALSTAQLTVQLMCSELFKEGGGAALEQRAKRVGDSVVKKLEHVLAEELLSQVVKIFNENEIQ